MQFRRSRSQETYSVDCPCGTTLEVSARIVDATGVITCSACWRTSRAEWKEGRQ
jgi:hypothetical protein